MSFIENPLPDLVKVSGRNERGELLLSLDPQIEEWFITKFIEDRECDRK